MDHIQNYFLKTSKKLVDKTNEKEILCGLINELSGVVVDKSNITIKNNTVKLKIFGTKRAKVISISGKIIEIMKDRYNIIIVSLD